jgi:hypothetical protein
METTSLLGAALAFSVVSLPVILILFQKNINQTILLSEAKIRKECVEDSAKIRNDFTKELESFKSSLNLDHKKLSVDTLDRISSKLVRIAEKIDPKMLDNLYD